MVKRKLSKKIVGVVDGYVKRLSAREKIPVTKVVVFGSHAKGATHKWSDIDVCVVSSRFTDPMEAMQFLLTKREDSEVSAGLEPVGFTPEDFESGGSLIDEIKRTGIELK